MIDVIAEKIGLDFFWRILTQEIPFDTHTRA